MRQLMLLRFQEMARQSGHCADQFSAGLLRLFSRCAKGGVPFELKADLAVLAEIEGPTAADFLAAMDEAGLIDEDDPDGVLLAWIDGETYGEAR